MLHRFAIAAIAAATMFVSTAWAGETTATKGSETSATASAKITTTPGGTKCEDLVVGTGAEAKAGSTAVVHYTGMLTNGTVFDSSKKHGQPFPVQNLGHAQVIKGWNEGVQGMKVGGKRKLTIPADQAYGAQSPSPLIPPNSVLVFEIELLDVK